MKEYIEHRNALQELYETMLVYLLDEVACYRRRLASGADITSILLELRSPQWSDISETIRYNAVTPGSESKSETKQNNVETWSYVVTRFLHLNVRAGRLRGWSYFIAPRGNVRTCPRSSVLLVTGVLGLVYPPSICYPRRVLRAGIARREARVVVRSAGLNARLYYHPEQPWRPLVCRKKNGI